MDIMRNFGITVPRGGVAHNLDEVKDVYSKVIGEGNDCVIKAMVLTGGRGLGHFSNGFKGGVHLCSKPGDVTNFASKMLGKSSKLSRRLTVLMKGNGLCRLQFDHQANHQRGTSLLKSDAC